ESTQLAAALVARSIDQIMIVDAGGIVRFANPAVERVLGHGPLELIGTALLALVHPDDLPSVNAAVSAVLADASRPLTFVCRLRDARGLWRWIDASGHNLLTDP